MKKKKIYLYDNVMSIFVNDTDTPSHPLKESELHEIIELHEKLIKPDFLFVINLKNKKQRIVYEKNYTLLADLKNVNFETIMSAISENNLAKLIQLDQIAALFSNRFFKTSFQYLMKVRIPVQLKKGHNVILHRTTTIMKMDNGIPTYVLGYYHIDKNQSKNTNEQLSYYFSTGQFETKETIELSNLFNEILTSNFILTKQEVNILTFLHQGESSKTIADKLFISINTVNTHRQNILKKLGVKNSSGAIQKALKFGMI